MENAGPENEGPVIDQIGHRPTDTRLENEGPNFHGKKCRTGKCGINFTL